MNFSWKLLSFDTEILGFRTAKIENISNVSDQTIKGLLYELQANNIAYATYRFPSSNFQLTQTLERNGFLLVDGIVALETEVTQVSPVDPHIRFVDEGDEEKLKKLSGQVFYLNRFYNDPEIPKEKANLVYEKWMENSLNKTAADCVLVWEENGEVEGFITVQNSGHIPLVGVSKAMRGKGIAKKLTNAALSYLKDKSLPSSVIETQIANIPAQRAYMSCGFKPTETFFTFRWKKENKI